MSLAHSHISESVKAFCARIGSDALLVQGAGGNVSWKDRDTLWIKASGTWLADAKMKEVFVPVNLPDLQNALRRKDFSAIPKVIGESSLKPSMETLLHALLPHQVVVHLHAVEILAHLVRKDSENWLLKYLGNAVHWTRIDYFKPGAELVQAVYEQLKIVPDADVFFLQNHGLVIGSDTAEKAEALLTLLTSMLKTTPLFNNSSSVRCPTTTSALAVELLKKRFIPCNDNEIHLLAIKEELASRLKSDWALYPDHVVFLGAEAIVIKPDTNLSDLDQILQSNPPFVFIIGDGAYQNSNATIAQTKQLRCYYDILIRQPQFESLVSLSKKEVNVILNCDAEIFRINTSK